MRIAIAGGTGVVGTHIGTVARERGHEVVVLARSRGIDLLSGAGLAAALAGVDAVIDVSNVTTLKADASISFFAGATRALLAAERATGVDHHIVLSIVGADAAPEGYYAGKLAQERLVEAASVPWTIQRATQFHEFAAQTYARAGAGPLRFAVRARTQPIAAREVAEHLVRRAEEGPAGRATDLGGPREESLAELMRAYARAIGHRWWMPPLNLPGAMGRAQRSGALLAGSDAVLGHQTFAEWLDGLPDA